jgi:hypothetical protein
MRSPGELIGRENMEIVARPLLVLAYDQHSEGRWHLLVGFIGIVADMMRQDGIAVTSDVFMETAAAVQLRQPVASTGEQIAHGQAGEVGFCVVVAREKAHQKQAASRGQRHAVVEGFWAVADD